MRKCVSVCVLGKSDERCLSKTSCGLLNVITHTRTRSDRTTSAAIRSGFHSHLRAKDQKSHNPNQLTAVVAVPIIYVCNAFELAQPNEVSNRVCERQSGISVKV